MSTPIDVAPCACGSTSWSFRAVATGEIEGKVILDPGTGKYGLATLFELTDSALRIDATCDGCGADCPRPTVDLMTVACAAGLRH